MKYEHVYLNEYGSPREARIGLRHYLTRYNARRPHSSLAYQTPAVVYTGARLRALSAPLPFGTYPFLAITLFGWVWAHRRSDRCGTLRRERGTRRSNGCDSAQ